MSRDNTTYIDDLFESFEEFEHTLRVAKTRANSKKEEGFLEGLENNYNKYGKSMFLSEAQYKWLTNIYERTQIKR